MSDSNRPHGAGNRQLIEREGRYGPGLWAAPLAFVRGQGVRLWDADGREYLDCTAGIAVASLGHAHPRLVEAIAEQARRLIVCPQNLANDVRGALLEELVPRLPQGLERVFLCNSDAEANEAALKWARVATGRRQLVAARRGFAGRTMGALSLTWEPGYREPFAPLRQPAGGGRGAGGAAGDRRLGPPPPRRARGSPPAGRARSAAEPAGAIGPRAGLMLGLEPVQDATASIEALRNEGVLATNAGADVIRFLPPLVIETPERS
jgi:acetylornithine/succinyldiaminopimelate/putrescine aminotransferase